MQVSEIDAKLDAMDAAGKSRGDKVQAMKGQWKAWQQWTKRAGLKFPPPHKKMPSGLADVVLEVWRTDFKKLLKHKIIISAAEYREKSMAMEQNMGGDAPDPLKVLSADFHFNRGAQSNV